jgi:hypothetical protein
MYIILTYGAYALLVVFASATLFGLCVAALIVQEGLRMASKTLSRTIELRNSRAEEVGS